MSKRKKVPAQQYNVAHLMPSELNALRALVKEFVTRIENIDNEIELLKEDRKELIEEYTEKLDIKTLNAALRVIKIQQGVDHKDTFDLFLSALEEQLPQDTN
jgi:uncharacterized protein (UPF0335 family)